MTDSIYFTTFVLLSLLNFVFPFSARLLLLYNAAYYSPSLTGALFWVRNAITSPLLGKYCRSWPNVFSLIYLSIQCGPQFVACTVELGLEKCRIARVPEQIKMGGRRPAVKAIAGH